MSSVAMTVAMTVSMTVAVDMPLSAHLGPEVVGAEEGVPAPETMRLKEPRILLLKQTQELLISRAAGGRT